MDMHNEHIDDAIVTALRAELAAANEELRRETSRANYNMSRADMLGQQSVEWHERYIALKSSRLRFGAACAREAVAQAVDMLEHREKRITGGEGWSQVFYARKDVEQIDHHAIARRVADAERERDGEAGR